MTDRAALADRFRHAASVWKGTCLAKVDVSAEVCDLDVIADALEAKPNAMTPAQDATALADRFHAVLRERTKIVSRQDTDGLLALLSEHGLEVCSQERLVELASFRATSQTPDAVRETFLACCERFVEGRPDWRVERVTREKREIISCHGSDRLAAEAAYKIALSTPSASAGPQAEAVNEQAPAPCADLSIGELLEWLSQPQYTNGVLDFDAVNHMQSACTLIERLIAHPQPQQAHGRGAVIEAQLRAIRKNLVETYNEATPSGYSIATSKVRQWIFAIDAALQQSDGSPK